MNKNEIKLLNIWLKNINYFFIHNKNQEEIKKEELISLKELAELIQNLYSKFKEEYNNLEKLDIGENNNIIHCDIEDDHKLLIMEINEQKEKSIVPNNFNILTLIGHNDEFQLYLKEDDMIDSKIITIDNIDQKILKEYFDIFYKYYPLFKLYIDLYQNPSLVSNGSHYLHMDIDANADSLINNLNGIKFNIQNVNELGDNYIINLYIDLTNGINIDYNKSEIIMNDSKKDKKEFGYIEILNQAFENIRFNRSSLKESQFIDYAEKESNKVLKK